MKAIKNYEGLYSVTSCGRVWSHRSKIFLQPHITENGYHLVALQKDGHREDFLIHRLVAEAYIDNPNNLPIVNHKDEVKSHNYINNLEWCDYDYNNNYGSRGKKVAKALSKKVKCVETGEIFESISAAAASVNRGKSGISSCLSGRYKTCGGYHWEAVE